MALNKDIYSQINNNHNIPSNKALTLQVRLLCYPGWVLGLQKFTNNSLPNICKMNNANLKLNSVDITNKNIAKYDLFDSHKIYMLTKLFTNYEQFIVNKNDYEYIKKNIEIFKNDYIREYLINFIKIHNQTDANILNDTEIYHLYNNINECIYYLTTKENKLSDYVKILKNEIEHMNSSETYNINDNSEFESIIKFENMCQFSFKLSNHNNYISSLKYNLFDVIRNNTDIKLLEKYNCDGIVKYITYICHQIYYQHTSMNNNKFDISSPHDISNIYSNFQMLDKKERDQIINFAFEQAYEIIFHIDKLYLFINDCRLILNNRIDDISMLWHVSAKNIQEYIDENINIIKYANLLSSQDLNKIIFNIDQEITGSTKLINELNSLYNSLNNNKYT